MAMGQGEWGLNYATFPDVHCPDPPPNCKPTQSLGSHKASCGAREAIVGRLQIKARQIGIEVEILIYFTKECLDHMSNYQILMT